MKLFQQLLLGEETEEPRSGGFEGGSSYLRLRKVSAHHDSPFHILDWQQIWFGRLDTRPDALEKSADLVWRMDKKVKLTV